MINYLLLLCGMCQMNIVLSAFSRYNK